MRWQMNFRLNKRQNLVEELVKQGHSSNVFEFHIQQYLLDDRLRQPGQTVNMAMTQVDDVVQRRLPKRQKYHICKY